MFLWIIGVRDGYLNGLDIEKDKYRFVYVLGFDNIGLLDFHDIHKYKIYKCMNILKVYK